MAKSSTPHDALFKATFSNEIDAAGALQGILNPAIAKLVDWQSLTLCSGSFVDDSLAQSHSDLLFSVNICDQPSHIYVLFEHQSSVDDLMAYRKLKYVSYTVDRHIEQARDNKVSPIPFPLVIPVLLHHSESGWTARTSVQELYHPAFTSNPIFAPYIPHLSFVLDDISHISNEALRQRAWRHLPTMTVLLLRDGRSPERFADDMTYWASVLEELSPDLRAMALISRYIELVAPDHLQQIFDAIAAHAPSAKDTLMTFSEVIAERVRKEALAEGEVKGELKGELKGQVAMLLKLLNRKFGDLPPAVRDRVTGASGVEIDRWTDNILSAATIDDVFAQ